MKKLGTAIFVILVYIISQETFFWYINASTEFKQVSYSRTSLQENIFYGDSLYINFDWGRKNISHGNTNASNRQIKVKITSFNKYYFSSWIPFGFRHLPTKIKALVIDENQNDTLGNYAYNASFQQLGFCSRKNMIRRIEKQFMKDVLSDLEIRKRGRNMEHRTIYKKREKCFNCREEAFFNLTYFTFDEKPGISTYCTVDKNQIDTFSIVPPNNLFNGDHINLEVVAFNASENKYRVERYYTSGQIAVRANFIHDIPPGDFHGKTYKTGIYRTWFPNGEIQNELISPDKEISYFKEYYPSGKLKKKYKYKHESNYDGNGTGRSGPTDTIFNYDEDGRILEIDVYN